MLRIMLSSALISRANQWLNVKLEQLPDGAIKHAGKLEREQGRWCRWRCNLPHKWRLNIPHFFLLRAVRG